MKEKIKGLHAESNDPYITLLPIEAELLAFGAAIETKDPLIMQKVIEGEKLGYYYGVDIRIKNA